MNKNLIIRGAFYVVGISVVYFLVMYFSPAAYTTDAIIGAVALNSIGLCFGLREGYRIRKKETE